MQFSFHMKRTDSRAFNFSCIFKNLQRFSMLILIWNESYPLSSAVDWHYFLTGSNQDQTIQTNISEAKASPLSIHLWHSCPDRDNGLILSPAKAKLCLRWPPKLRQLRVISWRRAMECRTGMSVTFDLVFLPAWKLTPCKPMLFGSLSHMALKSTGFSHGSPPSNQILRGGEGGLHTGGMESDVPN